MKMMGEGLVVNVQQQHPSQSQAQPTAAQFLFANHATPAQHFATQPWQGSVACSQQVCCSGNG